MKRVILISIVVIMCCVGLAIFLTVNQAPSVPALTSGSTASPQQNREKAEQKKRQKFNQAPNKRIDTFRELSKFLKEGTDDLVEPKRVTENFIEELDKINAVLDHTIANHRASWLCQNYDTIEKIMRNVHTLKLSYYKNAVIPSEHVFNKRIDIQHIPYKLLEYEGSSKNRIYIGNYLRDLSVKYRIDETDQHIYPEFFNLITNMKVLYTLFSDYSLFKVYDPDLQPNLEIYYELRMLEPVVLHKLDLTIYKLEKIMRVPNSLIKDFKT